MAIDLLESTQKLKIINVWQPGNPTGIVTDPRLYSTTAAGSRAPGWPKNGKGRGGIKHATVGSNSLRYLAKGSTEDGRWVSAHYLDPKDQTRLPNGVVMDTTDVLFKMIPDGYGANHCHPGKWRGYVNTINSNFYGFEVENLQDGKDPFTLAQYIKFALCWAYLAARDTIPDVMLADHGVVAPPGHRTDPYTGGIWDDALFYGLLWDIRKDARIFMYWGLPQYQGR